MPVRTNLVLLSLGALALAPACAAAGDLDADLVTVQAWTVFVADFVGELSMDLWVEVHNDGPDATPGTDLQFLVAPVGPSWVGDALGPELHARGTAPVPGLGADEGAIVKLRLDLPPGRYAAQLFADHAGLVPERDEANNYLFKEFLGGGVSAAR